MKKKKLVITIILLFLCGGIYLSKVVSDIVRNGYDKQNKIILFVKSIISPHYIKKIKNNLFIIPNLKARNDFLELQIQKYEQGNNGFKFDTNFIEFNNETYEINFFFLPFKKLDTNLGWNAESNSLRAHYSEVYNGKVFSISGDGKLVYFDKNNLLNDKLQFINLPNNINEILLDSESELVGIRDLYFENNYIFISMLSKNYNGISLKVYKAKLNFEKINFEVFFETNEYWKTYNVFSGGRLEKFRDNKILLSIGFAKNYEAPQDKESLLGKIVSIDLDTKKYNLISYGHRNPQGLNYHSGKDIVINTEHGPKGGDEINFNFLNLKEEKNFGWPRVSYGKAYPGEEKLFEPDTFDLSHEELGFIEPIKYYDPSIGISEILYLEKNSFCEKKCLLVSSLRANSIYHLNISDNFKQLSSNGRIFLQKNRIRDMDYDKDLDLIIILTENVPALVTIKKIA